MPPWKRTWHSLKNINIELRAGRVKSEGVEDLLKKRKVLTLVDMSKKPMIDLCRNATHQIKWVEFFHPLFPYLPSYSELLERNTLKRDILTPSCKIYVDAAADIINLYDMFVHFTRSISMYISVKVQWKVWCTSINCSILSLLEFEGKKMFSRLFFIYLEQFSWLVSKWMPPFISLIAQISCIILRTGPTH